MNEKERIISIKFPRSIELYKSQNSSLPNTLHYPRQSLSSLKPNIVHTKLKYGISITTTAI